MSVMTDGEIVAALDAGELVISPIGSRAEQIQPCSVDLRLSREILRYKARLRGVDDAPTIRLGTSLHHEMEAVDVGTKSAFALEPNAFVLGVTMERVKLPPYIVGRVEGRSSVGRAGLFVHVSAGFIDPGFEGRITLMLFNASPRVIEVPFGFKICQLTLHRLAVPCVRPYGAARGSKYVGEASASVQPAREEPTTATDANKMDESKIKMLLKRVNPPDEVEYDCASCGATRATYVYLWSTGEHYYSCNGCGARIGNGK